MIKQNATARQFIAGLGGAIVTWPLHARSKQATEAVIGFLDAGSAADRTYVAAAFRQGLAEGGYSEGQNIRIEFRWANGRFDQLPALLTDLVGCDVTMIAAFGNSAARAAKIARTTLPVVFASSSDPVAIGLVTSLNRPGANMTGVSILNQELEIDKARASDRSCSASKHDRLSRQSRQSDHDS